MIFREATKEDVIEIVKMLANDKLGTLREDFKEPLPDKYYVAFDNIKKDKNQELMVLEGDDNTVVGTVQISFIQYLTYQGGIRAQIEAIRIHEDYRGQGLGEKMIDLVIKKCKKKGAHVVQLTTDKERGEALKFYEKLGFIATHEGMKLHFEN